ncbi:dual specificity protein kinase yak1, partial [Cladochytrium tenue]
MSEERSTPLLPAPDTLRAISPTALAERSVPTGSGEPPSLPGRDDLQAPQTSKDAGVDVSASAKGEEGDEPRTASRVDEDHLRPSSTADPNEAVISSTASAATSSEAPATTQSSLFVRVSPGNAQIPRPSAPSAPDNSPASASFAVLLTQFLLPTYSACNPEFDYRPDRNPRRVLTKPSKPALNNGYDNEDSDYILYVNDVLGTFGQVVKCMNMKTKDLVAVKVIKNKPAYYNQSLVEVTILDLLNRQWDREDKHHIVVMKDTFLFRNHLCIVFEMLSINLYELIKQNQFRGLSTNLVRVFVQQILDCLIVLNKAKIIHCDLKPENVLLKGLDSPDLKVIDFGSACHENQTVYTYIQSRFYRSPEVLVGLPYTSSIDMWSLGCIAAELFLGLPLFPGASEYNQVARIVEILGVPHSYMCDKGKTARTFFVKDGEGRSSWRMKTMEEYSRETGNIEQPSKRYFKGTTLNEIINSYPINRKGLPQKEIDREMMNRLAFVDFLNGVLNLNPLERWSPQQAKMHPFVTGERLTGPFSIARPFSGSPVPPAADHAALRASPADSPSAEGREETHSMAPIGVDSVLSGMSAYRRARANTISSSKVGTVPPNLLHLVAIQQQSGPNKARLVRERNSQQQLQNQAAASSPRHADETLTSLATLATAKMLQLDQEPPHLRQAVGRRSSSNALIRGDDIGSAVARTSAPGTPRRPPPSGVGLRSTPRTLLDSSAHSRRDIFAEPRLSAELSPSANNLSEGFSLLRIPMQPTPADTSVDADSDAVSIAGSYRQGSLLRRVQSFGMDPRSFSGVEADLFSSVTQSEGNLGPPRQMGTASMDPAAFGIPRELLAGLADDDVADEHLRIDGQQDLRRHPRQGSRGERGPALQQQLMHGRHFSSDSL